MAKVTSPLMSLDASGTVGNTATFSKWKGRNYVRLRVTPRNPKSSGQAAVRQKLGAVGVALSYILYPTKANGGDASQFYTDALAYAPTGQSWMSYAMRTILGTNFSTFNAAQTAFLSIGSTPIGKYATAAGSLGLSAFNLSYGSLDALTAAALLYHLVKFATEQLGYTLSAGTLASPDDTALAAFVEYCNTAI